jgi:hypothetical protein
VARTRVRRRGVKMPTLILTPRFTPDSQSLWRAAGTLGWDVERLTSWRVPEHLRSVPDPVLYLEALFGPTLAQDFGLQLLEPDENWLPQLPEEFRKRCIQLLPIQEARQLKQPAFIKPPNSKSFPAGVYRGDEIPTGYEGSSYVLAAEIVKWEKEFRCFILDRKPRTISVYLRDGELQRDCDFVASDGELAEAMKMVQSVLDDPRVHLPKAAVVDIGVIAGRGWAVVEQNAAWGSGIYGCDPVEVLQVLRHAAVRTIPHQ